MVIGADVLRSHSVLHQYWIWTTWEGLKLRALETTTSLYCSLPTALTISSVYQKLEPRIFLALIQQLRPRAPCEILGTRVPSTDIVRPGGMSM
jgi:hypothetical protein